MNGWKRSGRGTRLRLVAQFAPQEAAVLRGLVEEVRQLLAGRTAANPSDELAVLTGMTTGPSTRPDDRVLARLLPDFTRDDPGLAGALRSLHEPALIAAKQQAVTQVLESLPSQGGRVEVTPEQADLWLGALNDVRLALGTALDVNEDMPEQLDADDPRAPHLGVYQWLTYVQDALVQACMRLG